MATDNHGNNVDTYPISSHRIPLLSHPTLVWEGRQITSSIELLLSIFEVLTFFAVDVAQQAQQMSLFLAP